MTPRGEILNRKAERRSNARKHRMGYARMYRAKVRAEFIAAYGGKCTCCEEAEPKFLTLEHIFKDGKEHRKRRTSGVIMLLHLRSKGWPKDRYTLLCMNCNWAGRFGPCPHKEYK